MRLAGRSVGSRDALKIGGNVATHVEALHLSGIIEYLRDVKACVG